MSQERLKHEFEVSNSQEVMSQERLKYEVEVSNSRK